MVLKKTLIRIFVLNALFFFSAQLSYATDLDKFLKQKAVKVDSSEVSNYLKEFLNYQSFKEAPAWFRGSILTAEDIQYDDLDINFNVLNNSIYLLNNGNVYRISNFALKGFEIIQKEKKMRFRKGFAVPSIAKLVMSFKGSTNDLIQYMTTYSKFSELQIKNISIERNQETEMTIQIITGFRDQVIELRNFFKSNENILSADLEHKASSVEPGKYLQVLYEHEKFTVLKYNFKRSATNEAVSVVKSSSAYLSDDEDYFVADATKHLQEFLFTKKSIEKVLSSIEISSSNKLKNVGNESGAIAWFESSTFN